MTYLLPWWHVVYRRDEPDVGALDRNLRDRRRTASGCRQMEKDRG
ncbi:hypothetical protein [Pasteuria penetrans]|nr:hypothetical protein [Pasteuria penetrans]